MKHPAVRWGVCFVLLFLAVLALLEEKKQSSYITIYDDPRV